MENEKYKISDFAALCGTSPKTIYNLIKSGELLSVTEIQRGRKITLVTSNNEQIEELQKRYGKDTSMKFQYYENETKFTENENTISENESKITGKSDNSTEIIDKVIEFSKTYNEQLMNYNERLLTVQEQLMNEKAKIPLLEDRQGLYLNELNELKKVNNRNKLIFTVIITSLTLLLIVITGLLIYNLMHPVTVTNTIIKEVPKEVIKYIKK